MSLAPSMQDLKDRRSASDRMPVVFPGHGSPMNAVEDNACSRSWGARGQASPRRAEPGIGGVHTLRATGRGGRPRDRAPDLDRFPADRLAARDCAARAVAGVADARDQLTFISDSIDIALVSMRSFIFP